MFKNKKILLGLILILVSISILLITNGSFGSSGGQFSGAGTSGSW